MRGHVKVFINGTCLFWSCWHFFWNFSSCMANSPTPPPHFFVSTLDSSLLSSQFLLVALPVEPVFSELRNINYMMTPCCYNYQNPSGFWKEDCDRFNFTEVSNLSVKGRRFGKLFQGDGVGKIKCWSSFATVTCLRAWNASYNHGQRLSLLR